MRRKSNLQKILLYTIFFIMVFIFIGTGLALIKKRELAIKNNKTETPSDIRGGIALYQDIGRLRAVTADIDTGTVVIFPIFEYNKKDKAFEEELLQKKEKIKSIIINWFKKYKTYEIYSMSEIFIKQNLLKEINKNLSLAKIKKMYFKEFIILE